MSNVAYTLSINAGTGGRSGIRMGSDVRIGPITTIKDGVTTTRVDYRQVGTNIDCSVAIIDDTRFSLNINIEDSSVATPAQAAGVPARTAGDSASFRHFSTSENVLLKDGQTTEFTVASDKFTGEVIKADVTLTVVK